MKFEELDVRPEIVRSLKEMGIEEPTEIQAKTIPLTKSGRDVIGMSKTGSGKTAAFGVPLLEKIVPGDGAQALIMAPTRELVVQIATELEKFSKYVGITVTQIFGGVGFGPQIEGMAKRDIIVCTPGRMLDHLQRGNADLTKVSTVVLDEADKMVDMGFIEDVDKILQATPKRKQVLLFGATLSSEIQRLKVRHTNDPAVVKAEEHVEGDVLSQYYYNIEAYEKFSLLVHLLKKEKADLSIVFCAKRSTVELVTRNLRAQGVKAEMIHGKLSQNRRLEVIERFRQGKYPVLVASAVAARGLDIRDVTHVFNYDLSQDCQEYIHRVGRTARAGDTGKAITLLSPNDHDAFRTILHRYQIDVELLPKENFRNLKFDTGGRSPRGRGGFSGRGRGRSSFRDGRGMSSERSGGRRRSSGRDSRGSRNRQKGRSYSGNRSGSNNRNNTGNSFSSNHNSSPNMTSPSWS